MYLIKIIVNWILISYSVIDFLYNFSIDIIGEVSSIEEKSFAEGKSFLNMILEDIR